MVGDIHFHYNEISILLTSVSWHLIQEENELFEIYLREHTNVLILVKYISLLGNIFCIP